MRGENGWECNNQEAGVTEGTMCVNKEQVTFLQTPPVMGRSHRSGEDLTVARVGRRGMAGPVWGAVTRKPRIRPAQKEQKKNK